MSEAALSKLLESLIRLTGLHASVVALRAFDNHTVRVLLDGVAAEYPLSCWTTRFLRDAYGGRFTAAIAG